MGYIHTQRGPLHSILFVAAAIILVAGWQPRNEPLVSVLLLVVGALMIGLAFCFRTLTVADEGDRLAIRFGPLPLFKKSFLYREMTSVERGSTALMDGWGIHYVPWRGWTYNLWGFQCAVLHVGKKTVRVGTDDAENLVAYLNQRIHSARE